MNRNPNMVGRFVAVDPQDALSFWQPRPANGYIDLMLTPDRTGCEIFVQGYQSIAPRCLIAPHLHKDVLEVLVCLSGTGRIVLDDRDVPFSAEVSCFVGHDVRHSVVNDGESPLRLLWMQFPPGHEQLFPRIGRPRRAGESAPEPFDRPENAAAWSKALGVEFNSSNGQNA